MNQNILTQIHPQLQKFILEIWANEKFGKVKVKSSSDKTGENMRQFILFLPFAGQILEWEVIFSNDDLSFSPDFYIPDDSFLDDCDAQVITNQIPSLANWNSNNPKSLIQVIQELLNLFNIYQMKLLEDEKYSKIHFQYISLISDERIQNKDIEVLIKSNDLVCFLISVHIDLSLLPYIEKTDKSGNPDAMLSIRFRGVNAINVTQSLELSSHAKEVLDLSSKIKIPKFNGCLIDSVLSVQDILTNQIQFLFQTYNRKRVYISHLLEMCRTNIVEFDSLLYSKAIFLFQTGDYSCLLKICLDDFPYVKPKWILRSIYNYKSFDDILADYPYDPTWCPKEMIKQAFQCIF